MPTASLEASNAASTCCDRAPIFPRSCGLSRRSRPGRRSATSSLRPPQQSVRLRGRRRHRGCASRRGGRVTFLRGRMPCRGGSFTRAMRTPGHARRPGATVLVGVVSSIGRWSSIRSRRLSLSLTPSSTRRPSRSRPIWPCRRWSRALARSSGMCFVVFLRLVVFLMFLLAFVERSSLPGLPLPALFFSFSFYNRLSSSLFSFLTIIHDTFTMYFDELI